MTLLFKGLNTEDVKGFIIFLFGIGVILAPFIYGIYTLVPKKRDNFSDISPSSSISEETPLVPSSTLQVNDVISETSILVPIYQSDLDTIRRFGNTMSRLETDGLNFPEKVMEGGNALVPKGAIIIWSGSDTAIPGGWVLCDGQNGTPDLRSRFVLGTGQGQNLSNRDIGQIGGLEKVALNENEMPTHTHDITYRTDDNTKTTTYGGTANVAATVTNLRKAGMTKTATSTPVGSGQSHENMPPFYVLAYIMKL